MLFDIIRPHGVSKALKPNSKWLLKVCHRLEETKEKITKCNRFLEQKKDPRGKAGEIQIKSVV